MHDGREVIAAGTYWIRRQQADRDECWHFGCLSVFLFIQPWSQAHGMAPPTVRVELPTSGNLA